MTDKILQIKNLYFKYQSENILENINLEIKKGDFALLIGDNGAGKSTLLKVILNEIKAYRGEITFPLLNNSYQIGYVPQLIVGNNLNFPITVFELVSLSLYHKVKGFKKLSEKDKKSVRNALEIVGMSDYENNLYKELSGGQRQRVLIAKAIVNSPSFLILDEPTAGIDYKSKLALFDLLEHFNNFHNMSILMVTHELSEVKHLANRIYLIKDKKIEEVK